MVHGACSSSGCYSMTDAQIEQIYAFGRDAFQGGQTEFQIQAFPFRMTAANMARYRNDPNYDFWKMLKDGYDHFEITKVPPKVDVCEKRYVFNQVADGKARPSMPTGACPPSTTQPDSLKTRLSVPIRASYDAAFTGAVEAVVAGAQADRSPASRKPASSRTGRNGAPAASACRSSRRRSADGTVIVTARMGRIDSPAGRKMAALDAEKAEAKRKRRGTEACGDRSGQASQTGCQGGREGPGQIGRSGRQPSRQPSSRSPPRASRRQPCRNAAASADEGSWSTGLLGSVRKRIGNIFGG